MANNVFDCLIEDVEPQSNLVWPTSVLEILENLKDYEGLRTSSAYHGFVDSEHIENRFLGALTYTRSNGFASQ